MRISQLSAESGVAVATIKFYLREGLLPAGRPTGATQADYDGGHLRRLRLIRALVTSVGLSTQQARVILSLVDEPGEDLYRTLGEAVGALPPAPRAPEGEDDPYPRARAALEALDQVYDPAFAAVGQLEAALAASETAGMPISAERLLAYGRALREIAEFDLDGMPAESHAAVEYTVLGTALYEPVILALRRLAHQDAAVRRLT